MPIPSERHCTSAQTVVSLPLLPDPKHQVRKSKMGPWRAAVLIAVHVLMIAHIVHWYVKGRTLSPVEPSESMYTINNGDLNAGFVFFAVAILSTAIFGRFFCGWGCHIVAVQDLCGWMMKRIGIHPKPFRSRLLVYAPVILAIYMFAWPTIKREIIRPVVGDAAWAALAPYVGEAGTRPEIKAAFIKQDFWETFAPWYVAIPFVGVCGFAIVYFLGAKGFCAYGCPYGGIFGPVDRLSPGRIRVTDACEHCGHCTAVCTSNVRVHEEVRDFGMVVDPGCMKCMDCVSVCPNDALYFGFGGPAVAAKPKAAALRKPRIYDLSWKEEFAYTLIFIALVFGFRGMFGLVPLLMAMGLAGIGTFLVWKFVCMVRTPSVRIHSFQLKLKGKVRPVGLVLALLALLSLGAGLWGAVVNAALWRGTALDSLITAPIDQVLTREYVSSESDRAIARPAIAMLTLAGPLARGGIGWDRSIDRSLRLARLHSLLLDLPEAESELRQAIAAVPAPPAVLESALIRVIRMRSNSADDFFKSLADLLNQYPKFASVRMFLAQRALSQGEEAQAVSLIRTALADRPEDELNRMFAIELLGASGKLDLAEELAAAGIALLPKSVPLRTKLGLVLIAKDELDRGLAELTAAADLDPSNPDPPAHIAEVLSRAGRESEATQWRERANKASRGSPSGPP